eukprot:TRINITY_DN2183_c0_g1_i1.p1 TRINITY_DN2183_c0_g1~~TRINITY_DN2183_c0_g1_i1.p1  ORF type:complete len:735 (+),score=239.45 TRINITY_DN2183_c0_g1_i1:167-2371(+)
MFSIFNAICIVLFLITLVSSADSEFERAYLDKLQFIVEHNQRLSPSAAAEGLTQVARNLIHDLRTGKSSAPHFAAPSFSTTQLPAQYDPRTQRKLIANRNQHLIRYCGSCWAWASVNALSDRFRLTFPAILSEIDLAPQNLIDCSRENNGCNGGLHVEAYKHIHKQGITDETCAPYRAERASQCGALQWCSICNSSVCVPENNYHKYYVSEYGLVIAPLGKSMVETMMNEIFTRGPIACLMSTPSSFANYSGGIYDYKKTDILVDHTVEIAGWGQENGVDYWIGRNSWGSWWGEEGWFYITKGKNTLFIETLCGFGVPSLTPSASAPSSSASASSASASRVSTSISTTLPVTSRSPCYRSLSSFSSIPFIPSSSSSSSSPSSLLLSEIKRFPYYNPQTAELPAIWDWRDVNGMNWISPVRNERSPHDCLSCYVFSAIGALSDRITIALGYKPSLPSLLSSSSSTSNKYTQTQRKRYSERVRKMGQQVQAEQEEEENKDIRGLLQRVYLSPQVTLNCVKPPSPAFSSSPSSALTDACVGGGHPSFIYSYLMTHSLTDDTCQAWVADGTRNCTAQTICENCEGGKEGCTPHADHVRYYRIRSFGFVSLPSTSYPPSSSSLSPSSSSSSASVIALQTELYHHGPITCALSLTASLFDTYAGEIISIATPSPPQPLTLTVSVTLVGWAINAADNMTYWICRTSFGTSWGDRGYLYINSDPSFDLGISRECMFADPLLE